ncbi:MAG: HD domain-containing phosphohydrolase [Chloroflexota bacterium]|nr:HD domain-containing phosphohydrolase [Chloroflexota bacterium]
MRARARHHYSRGAAIVQAHHERFDGHGYPRALPAEKIPLGARIFAVAEAFGAMTSDLPYRQARSSQDRQTAAPVLR